MSEVANAAAQRARQLLHTAGDASRQLEESVRELITMRAWDVLGYANFSEMWEKENGFEVPALVRAMAMSVYFAEGVKLHKGRQRVSEGPHTYRSVADDLGYHVSQVHRDLDKLFDGYDLSQVADKYKHRREQQRRQDEARLQGRARQRPRRLGKGTHELVQEGFALVRADADEIAEIARQADVSKAEIYRQAIAEYLARHRASRPVKFSGEAS